LALLESVETLQVVSLIPVALVLHRLNHRSVLSLFITVIGVAGMLAGIVIDIGFATGLVSFAEGPIGGPAFYISEGLVLLWLLATNMLACDSTPWSEVWHSWESGRRSLRRSYTQFGRSDSHVHFSPGDADSDLWRFWRSSTYSRRGFLRATRAVRSGYVSPRTSIAPSYWWSASSCLSGSPSSRF
jgi:hypothetical protein